MSRRRCITYAPRLAGRRFHVILDLDGFDPPAPIGITIEAKKEGSHEREGLRALARQATLALGAGVPVATVAAGLRGIEGGPDGAVVDCDGVTWASSPADLVGQILELQVAP